MKKPFLLYSVLLFSIYSSAQVDKDKPSAVTSVSAKDIESMPFSRGINNFTIQQNFGFSRIKPENSDNHSRQIDLNLDYNRFVVDHIGVGVDLDLSSIRIDVNNNVGKTTEWMLYGNVIYGNSFGNNFNLYGKVSVGFGKSKSKYTSFPSDEEDLFGYKFEIGAPIHLYSDGGNYITPFISYNYVQQKDNGAKLSVNEFDFGFRFQNYSPCSTYQCDCSHGRGFSTNMYEQGRSFIGYSSMGQYGFGTSKFNLSDAKTDVSGGSLDFEYGYYLTRDIALGAGVSWTHASEEDDNGKATSSALSFMPIVTLNAPTKDCFENLFLQAGYGFGFQKTEVGPSEIKYNTSNFCIDLGFNHFFGRHIAVTPKIGYESETFKNTDTDLKNKQSGFEFGIGCSLHW